MKFVLCGLFVFILVSCRFQEAQMKGDIFFEESYEPRKKVDIKIHHVNAYGASSYMKVRVYVHEDRTEFDIFSELFKSVGNNYLIMNMKLRAKLDGSDKFVSLYQWKGMDFCGFLSEFKSNPIIQQLFKKSMHLNELIICPIPAGNYSATNFNVENNIHAKYYKNGTYKMFFEIIEECGEIPKLFAFQVTIMVRIMDTYINGA